MSDEEFYLKATNEVENGQRNPALWAKVMALTEGNEDKAKYKYINHRVAQLLENEIPNNHVSSALSEFTFDNLGIYRRIFILFNWLLLSTITLLLMNSNYASPITLIWVVISWPLLIWAHLAIVERRVIQLYWLAGLHILYLNLFSGLLILLISRTSKRDLFNKL